MKYTERTKLAAVADSLFAIALVAVLYFKKTDLINNFGVLLTIIVVFGAICIAASFYKEEGKYKKWRNIWKDPVWQTAGYIILAVGLIASIWIFPELGIAEVMIFILIMVNCLIRDIRYCIYAVRFDMDNLEDVNELANKYPEARPMIKRKRKKPEESDHENE